MEHEKMHQVIVDPAASHRMQEHFEFLAQVNENAANRMLEELLASIRSLETFPFSHPLYDRPYLPLGKYRFMVVNKRYRVVYQINGEFIFIDDIQDCRQDEDKGILNLEGGAKASD